MQQFYGLDLITEYELAGARRLCVLVLNLPAESRLWRERGRAEEEPSNVVSISDFVAKHQDRLH